MNLLLNARDALPQGGSIKIETFWAPESSGVYLMVADTGSGIAPNTLPKIMESFYTTKAHGTGLGLPITVTRSSGNIAAPSTLSLNSAEERPSPYDSPEGPRPREMVAPQQGQPLPVSCHDLFAKLGTWPRYGFCRFKIR
jgi:two-component system, NtrC family, sensor kinase